jgi:hypothetical protein
LKSLFYVAFCVAFVSKKCNTTGFSRIFIGHFLESKMLEMVEKITRTAISNGS